MKIYRLTIICAFILGVIAFGCKPENVKPGDNGEVGAYAADSDHTDFNDACQTPVSYPLTAFNYLGTGQNVTLGSLYVGNNTDITGFVFQSSSFVFDAVSVWTGSGKDWSTYPIDENGNMLPSAFDKRIDLNPVLPEYRVNVNMKENQQTINASAWANIKFMQIDPNTGNLVAAIDENVWATDKLSSNSHTFSYTNMLTGCPGACEPWIGATTNPCASAVTTGSTTEGDCSATKGKNKCLSETTVDWDCNNASCVSVSSCKDLSNVVLVTADGTHQKYDGLSAKTGTFCASNGGDIVTVYVKSGCYKSGEGPGYGWRHDNPLNCNGGGTTGGSTGGGTTIDI